MGGFKGIINVTCCAVAVWKAGDLPVVSTSNSFRLDQEYINRDFQHANFRPIVDKEKRGAHYLVHVDAKAAPVAGTTLRTTGLVPAYSRQ